MTPIDVCMACMWEAWMRIENDLGMRLLKYSLTKSNSSEPLPWNTETEQTFHYPKILLNCSLP